MLTALEQHFLVHHVYVPSALYKRSGIDVPDDNQVDATWLRQMGLAHLGDPDAVPLPQTHLSALDKVAWP